MAKKQETEPKPTKDKKPFWKSQSVRIVLVILALFIGFSIINILYQGQVEDIYARSKSLDASIVAQADMASPAAVMPANYDLLVKEAVALSRSPLFFTKVSDTETFAGLLRKKYDNNLIIVENDKSATSTANLWGMMYKDPDCAQKFGNENCKAAIMKMVDGISPNTKKITTAKSEIAQINKQIEDLFLITN